MPANAAEERALFERYHKHRDYRARKRLIEGGLRFVIKTAKQYYRGDIDFLRNLIAAGNIGLMVAVDKYRPWVIQCRSCNTNNYVSEPQKQKCKDCHTSLYPKDAKHYTTRFLTYAAWWISEAMRAELYESSLVHIPPYKQKEHHRERQEGKKAGFTYVSIDEMLDTGPQVIEDGEESVLYKDAQRLLHRQLTTMKDRHAYVIIAYYGLREEPKTLREIAQKLGVCPERVRQIKEDALLDLKQRLMRHRVKSVADVCRS